MENEYDDLLDEAEELAKEDIAAKLSGMEFDGSKMKEAFKDDPEADKHMDRLVAHLKDDADSATKKKAWQEFGVNAGMKSMKLALKVLKGGLGVLLAVFLAAPAHAGVLDLDGPFDWIKENSKRTRAGFGINFKGELAGTVHLPLMWDKLRNYADVGVGFTQEEGGVKHVTAGFGINLVTASHDLWKRVLGKRIDVMPLPGFWLGPRLAAPPLDDIKETWVIGEKLWIVFDWKFSK